MYGKPRTDHEATLQEVLRASNAVVMAQKQVIAGMQAQTVLQAMYLEGVRGQLQDQEIKKAKKRKTGKINMDGRAKILTQNDIVKGVREWQDGQDKAIEDAATKKRAKERYGAAMDVWKVREMDRKDRNGTLKSGWEAEVKVWSDERDDTKCDHRKPRWTKPKMPTMEKALHKPLLADFIVQKDSKEEEEDDENDCRTSDGSNGPNQ